MTLGAFLVRNRAFLGAGALLTFLSSFGQTYFISVFSGEIREAFGLSHGDWGGIYAAGTIASAIVMVWLGALTDHYRVRALAGFVLVGLAVACLVMALNPLVWILPVGVFLLRLFGQGMASHVATVAIARWFVATRGRALAIASLGFAAGEAVLPLLFVFLLRMTEWRLLWIGAAVVSVLMIPLIIRLLQAERTPKSVAEETEAFGMRGLHWTRRAAVGHWVFWIMVPAMLGPAAFTTAFFFHHVHIAEVKGWSHLDLVALFPVYTLAGVIAMFVSGFLIDRFGSSVIAAVTQAPFALGYLIFGLTDTLALGAVGIVCIAVAAGMNTTMLGAIWAEYYGTRFMGSIKALAMAVMVLGSALGPAVTGYAIDLGIDFPDQLTVIALWFCGVCVLVSVGLYRARRLFALTPEVDVIRP
ncbi:MFS transporter [Rhodophyticola sp. MJ-SS7]|nr:MFS transporter [Rhodophyticola sp. MJ-SS7]